MKYTKDNIKELENKGWIYWSNYGYERMYLNIKKVMDVDTYKNSGMVSSINYKGVSYPHVFGNTLINTKIYIDLKHGELHKPELREDIQELLDLVLKENLGE